MSTTPTFSVVAASMDELREKLDNTSFQGWEITRYQEKWVFLHDPVFPKKLNDELASRFDPEEFFCGNCEDCATVEKLGCFYFYYPPHDRFVAISFDDEGDPIACHGHGEPVGLTIAVAVTPSVRAADFPKTKEELH